MGGSENIDKAISTFKKEAREENWAIGQVHDVANATKHVIRRGAGVSYRDVSPRPIVAGVLRAGWPINGVHVMVEVEPGQVWLVKDLVTSADEWWRAKLNLPQLQNMQASKDE